MTLAGAGGRPARHRLLPGVRLARLWTAGRRRATARVRLIYWWRHHRLLALGSPARFTELVQWRKLHDDDPRRTRLVDKVGVKPMVAALLGADAVTPTLYAGPDWPADADWPLPYVVKARHGCGQHLFVRAAGDADAAARRTAARWSDRAYGGWLDEGAYADVPRGLIVEPFIGDGASVPVDYKCYVFAGTVAAVQVHDGREGRHRWWLMTPDWTVIGRGGRVRADDAVPRAPDALPDILSAAAILGTTHDFVRADFYAIDGRARFGELSFYPGSGLDPFACDAIDLWLGGMWHDARARLGLAPATRARADRTRVGRWRTGRQDAAPA